MSEALRGFFLIFIFALIMNIQFNLDADKTATRQIKNSLELAVHDASLAVDENQLGKGFIVFDQGQAEIYFKDSLMFHLDLDSELVPNNDSFYEHPFELKLLQFVDDKTEDPNNPGQTITFPYIYTDSLYDIVEVLYGPSVIAVIETTSPRYFSGDGITIRQAAVYEYFN
ncbi:hypothetical protein [Sutcliffiella cohnii]|uniref:hypothetical protein n=1 Tax=Sutcliffiella cohnii TaxID=33932 RepID=UPI00082FCD32|nr:hypothetical protein [Sutcliffiella cohnii]